MYPQLKGSFPENLKHLKDTMDGMNWKVSSFPCPGTLPLLTSRAALGRGGVSREAILRKLEAAYQHPENHSHGRVTKPCGVSKEEAGSRWPSMSLSPGTESGWVGEGY